MGLFKRKPNLEKNKALEKLVRDNFCGKQSVVGCPHYEKFWCERNCGFYAEKLNQAKYWMR